MATRRLPKWARETTGDTEPAAGSVLDAGSAAANKKSLYRRIATLFFTAVASKRTPGRHNVEYMEAAAAAFVGMLNSATGISISSTVFEKPVKGFMDAMREPPLTTKYNELLEAMKQYDLQKFYYLVSDTEKMSVATEDSGKPIVKSIVTYVEASVALIKEVASVQRFDQDDDEDDDAQLLEFQRALKRAVLKFVYHTINAFAFDMSTLSEDYSRALLNAIGSASDIADVLATKAATGTSESESKLRRLETRTFQPNYNEPGIPKSKFVFKLGK